MKPLPPTIFKAITWPIACLLASTILFFWASYEPGLFFWAAIIGLVRGAFWLINFLKDKA